MQTDTFLNLPTAPRGVPLWQHVRQSIIDLIRNGDLTPGQSLPTHSELCQQIGVSHVTMQRILSALAREGWIVRYRRRGTFVADTLPQTKDQVVAVIARAAFSDHLEGSDLRMVRAVRRIFQEDHQRFRFYPEQVDEVFAAYGSGPLSLDSALMSDVEAGRVGGLLVFRPTEAFADRNHALRQRLIDHRVPVVAVNAWRPVTFAASTCYLDFHALFLRAFALMQAAGRKRIGLVCQRQTGVSETLLSMAWRAARDRGIQDQIVELLVEAPPKEEAGYRVVSEFFDRGEAPLDGLVVSDDWLAKGAASALVQRGISVPDSMLVVTQGNVDSGVTYPLPFVRIEFDMERLMRTAWDQLKSLKEGFRPTRTRLWVPPESGLALSPGLEWLNGAG